MEVVFLWGPPPAPLPPGAGVVDIDPASGMSVPMLETGSLPSCATR
jgi:hypothetical protein